MCAKDALYDESNDTNFVKAGVHFFKYSQMYTCLTFKNIIYTALLNRGSITTCYMHLENHTDNLYVHRSDLDRTGSSGRDTAHGPVDETHIFSVLACIMAACQLGTNARDRRDDTICSMTSGQC